MKNHYEIIVDNYESESTIVYSAIFQSGLLMQVVQR